MNTAAKLDATLRTKFGKGASRQDRMKGRTPAVIYGHGAEARHITVDAHEVAKILRHKNAVIDLNLDGKVESVLVKSATKDPVTQVIEHIDLVGLVAGEPVIDLEHKTVKLEVAATSIPDFVEAIFDKQGAGFHVLAKDLIIPAGAKLELAADELIASVVATAAGHAAELAAPAAE
jgi:large subunit ribosomal protein L25